MLIDDLEVEDPFELIGQSWTYKLRVRRAVGLPSQAAVSYFQYNFLGETFTSAAVEQRTRDPEYCYEFVHHVEEVTPKFLDMLAREQTVFHVWVTPVVELPADVISTSNRIVKENFETHRLESSESTQQRVRQIATHWAQATKTKTSAPSNPVAIDSATPRTHSRLTELQTKNLKL